MRLAAGLHRVGSDVVNSYLVEDAAGVVIVDAGLPGHWREMQAELTRMGRSLDDVRGIVLTHGDTDHIGFAERLRRGNGVSVHVHELDAARARGEVKKPNSGWGPIKMRPLLGFLWYSARRGGLRVRPVAEVVTSTDGDVLDLRGSPRVIHVPGHTPDSVAVPVPAVDALFVGDAMTTGHVLTGQRGPRPAPFTLEPQQALASLANLGGWTTSYASTVEVPVSTSIARRTSPACRSCDGGSPGPRAAEQPTVRRRAGLACHDPTPHDYPALQR